MQHIDSIYHYQYPLIIFLSQTFIAKVQTSGNYPFISALNVNILIIHIYAVFLT